VVGGNGDGVIARLTGRVDAVTESNCIMDVNGVGYLVQASTRTLGALPPPPAAVQLLVETHVREDAILLYGFADPAERDWFRLLTTVQGVGAKVALAILSALSPRDLVAAIASADRASLTRAAGVGAKLAVRILSELRDKAGAMPAGASLPAAAAAVLTPRGAAEDALSALVNLGYRRAEAQPVVARIVGRLGEDAPVDTLIRDSLKELAPRAVS
jgi:Holliday junction DNA helicase RuvA